MSAALALTTSAKAIVKLSYNGGTCGRITDFARLDYLSFTGDGGHVVALIEIGIEGANTTTIISEHWDIVGDKAVRLRVACYDPTLLLAQLSAAPIVP